MASLQQRRTRTDIPLSALLFLAALVLAGSCRGAISQSLQSDPTNNPASNGNVDSNVSVPLPGTDPEEDLSDISLANSKLHFSEPISGGIEETQGYIREFYRMQWRSGDPVEVYVIRPKGVAKPPVTIYLYGFPADEGRFVNPAFCKLVTRGGVAAIGFVPALVGQRYHNVPMRKWFVSELHDSIVRTAHDVQMLVTYVASRPDLDGQRIDIFGEGAGATIAGLAAAADPRIQAVDLLDPWGDWPDWMAKSTLVPEAERADYLKPAFLNPLAALDPVRWLPRLASRPIKLDEALYETVTPPAAKAKIDAAVPASALVVRYPTKADFDTNALADGKLIAWIQRQVRTTSALDANSEGRR